MTAKKRRKPSPLRRAGPQTRPVRRYLVVGALLLLAVVVRLVAAHQIEYPQVDGYYYLDQARELVGRGHLPHSTFPPGFPLLVSLALVGRDIDDPLAPLRAAQTVNVVLGTVLGLLTYLVLRRRLDEMKALIAAVIVWFLPHGVYLSKVDLSEMSYACCLLGGWLAWSRRHWIPAGLLLGYAYLIRPEALLIPAVLVMVTVRTERRFPWRFAVSVLLSVVPYMAFLYQQTGQLTLSSKMVFLTQTTAENPGVGLLDLALRNLWLMLRGITGLLGFPLCALAAIGAMSRVGAWAWWLLPLGTLPFFSFAMGQRYWVPYLPFLLLAAGLGWTAIRDRWPWLSTRRGGLTLAVVLMVGLGWAVVDDANLYTKQDEVYPILRKAGLWLRNRVDRDTVVAAYKPQASYWAWSRFTPVPADLDAVTVVDEVKKAGAEYLVVDVYTSLLWRPELLVLSQDPDKALMEPLDRRLERIAVLVSKKDFRQNTCIYRIK